MRSVAPWEGASPLSRFLYEHVFESNREVTQAAARSKVVDSYLRGRRAAQVCLGLGEEEEPNFTQIYERMQVLRVVMARLVRRRQA